MEPAGIRNAVPLLPRVAVEHHAHLGDAVWSYSSSDSSSFSDGVVLPGRRVPGDILG